MITVHIPRLDIDTGPLIEELDVEKLQKLFALPRFQQTADDKHNRQLEYLVGHPHKASSGDQGDQHGSSDGDRGPYATRWGRMTIVKAEMNRYERHHSYRHSYSFVGPFRYPHRALPLASDGRAWHHRVSGKGGTVLIDNSSSMHINPADVLHILANNPLAKVALYWGNGGASGTLTVVAENNRYATRWSRSEGANIIDLPALKWLARQERPRYWVCDGWVTGVNDNLASIPMVNDCAHCIRGAGIKWVYNLEQLGKALRIKVVS